LSLKSTRSSKWRSGEKKSRVHARLFCSNSNGVYAFESLGLLKEGFWLQFIG
jgi:hypothetical protein